MLKSGKGMLLAAVLALSACSSSGRDASTRILLVGNSITYVNNLPAVLEALARANDRPITADMLVSGGATLADHLPQGAVAQSLERGAYDYVVLQERGSDLLCYAFDARLVAQCTATHDAHDRLVAMAPLIR